MGAGVEYVTIFYSGTLVYSGTLSSAAAEDRRSR